VKIVVADDLPASALDLLRAEGWEIDARTGRAPEQLASISQMRTRSSFEALPKSPRA
jgi:hypothetical protein